MNLATDRRCTLCSIEQDGMTKTSWVGIMWLVSFGLCNQTNLGPSYFFLNDVTAYITRLRPPESSETWLFQFKILPRLKRGKTSSEIASETEWFLHNSTTIPSHIVSWNSYFHCHTPIFGWSTNTRNCSLRHKSWITGFIFANRSLLWLPHRCCVCRFPRGCIRRCVCQGWFVNFTGTIYWYMGEIGDWTPWIKITCEIEMNLEVTANENAGFGMW